MGRLIGIGGRLAAGKDTIADYLVGKGWLKFGMSDPLHQSMMKLNPIVDTYGVEGGFDVEVVTYREATEARGYAEAKAEFPEYRRLLQAFGTEVGRDLFGENVWVDVMSKRVAGALGGGHNVAVTGIRYPNEVEVIKRLGGALWWVDRGDSHGVQPAVHTSESSVGPDDFGLTIHNVGTLKQLYQLTDQTLRS